MAAGCLRLRCCQTSAAASRNYLRHFPSNMQHMLPLARARRACAPCNIWKIIRAVKWESLLLTSVDSRGRYSPHSSPHAPPALASHIGHDIRWCCAPISPEPPPVARLSIKKRGKSSGTVAPKGGVSLAISVSSAGGSLDPPNSLPVSISHSFSLSISLSIYDFNVLIFWFSEFTQSFNGVIKLLLLQLGQVLLPQIKANKLFSAELWHIYGQQRCPATMIKHSGLLFPH